MTIPEPAHSPSAQAGPRTSYRSMLGSLIVITLALVLLAGRASGGECIPPWVWLIITEQPDTGTIAVPDSWYCYVEHDKTLSEIVHPEDDLFPRTSVLLERIQ